MNLTFISSKYTHENILLLITEYNGRIISVNILDLQTSDSSYDWLVSVIHIII